MATIRRIHLPRFRERKMKIKLEILHPGKDLVYVEVAVLAGKKIKGCR